MKRILSIILAAVLCVLTMTACNSKQKAEPQAAPGVYKAVGMANPWAEITEEEAHNYCPQLFKAPDGAEVQAWLVCKDLADPSAGVGAMIQLSFAQYGMNFTARAQEGVNEDADISGLYTEWTVGP